MPMILCEYCGHAMADCASQCTNCLMPTVYGGYTPPPRRDRKYILNPREQEIFDKLFDPGIDGTRYLDEDDAWGPGSAVARIKKIAKDRFAKELKKAKERAAREVIPPYLAVPSKEDRHPEASVMTVPPPVTTEPVQEGTTMIETFLRQVSLNFPNAEALTEEEKHRIVDPANPANPFHKIIGQSAPVAKLCRLAYQAIGRNDHFAGDVSTALLGPPGTGKTTLAKRFAELVGLPFVNLNPKALKSTEDVFDGMQRVFGNFKVRHPDTNDVVTLKMIPQEEPHCYSAPVCVVFIDEVHQLCDAVEQGLLTATEADTATLETPSGKIIDTSNVCWIIATTDRGMLFDAFDSRFSKVLLKPYTQDEIAQIVYVSKEESLPFEVCRLIAKYSSAVTREAIDFATEVIHQQEYSGGSWEQAVEQIRIEQGIDELGMSETRLNILKALGQRGPIAIGKLANVARVKEDELKKYTLAPMEVVSEVRDALVQPSGRGYWITEAGLKELDLRMVSHRGSAVLPKR